MNTMQSSEIFWIGVCKKKVESLYHYDQTTDKIIELVHNTIVSICGVYFSRVLYIKNFIYTNAFSFHILFTIIQKVILVE
jgi:hypothetical protein